MLITADYARENRRLHQVDETYGAEGYLWAYHVAGIARMEFCVSILDYGAGKGTLARTLRQVGFDCAEYDPGYLGKESLPAPADLVVCLDVMEHIEPDCVDAVVDHLALLAQHKLFVVISTKLSKRKMADGRDTHISLHDDGWWMKKFTSRGFTIQRVWNTGLRLWVALLNPPARA